MFLELEIQDRKCQRATGSNNWTKTLISNLKDGANYAKLHGRPVRVVSISIDIENFIGG